MANKTLSLCSIEEFKDKLIRFYFSIGGFFGGYYNVELIKNDTKIKYIFSHSIKGNEDEYEFSEKQLNYFLEKIFNEYILNWKNKYDNNNILDGTQWKLEMEFKDLPKFESYGSNEYPSNWKMFLSIIYKYFPQMNEIYEDEDYEEKNR